MFTPLYHLYGLWWGRPYLRSGGPTWPPWCRHQRPHWWCERSDICLSCAGDVTLSSMLASDILHTMVEHSRYSSERWDRTYNRSHPLGKKNMLFSNQDSGWKPFEGRHFYCIHDDHPLLLNPFFLLLKLPQIKTNRIGVALLCFLVGHNWIFNCVKWESIGEQDSKTMGSTVQPPINEKSIATWRFFTRVPSHKFHFFNYY